MSFRADKVKRQLARQLQNKTLFGPLQILRGKLPVDTTPSVTSSTRVIMATRLVPRPVRSLGRQLGRHSTCRCVASLSLRHTKPPTRRNVNSVTPVCLDRGRSGGVGGDDGELNTNVLYERMKALREQELEAENDPVVDALEEKDQAIVAEIRGDAAERVMPERALPSALVFFKSRSTGLRRVKTTFKGVK